MLKHIQVTRLVLCLLLIGQLHGKHFHSLEEDLTNLIKRAIEFADTGIYKPYQYTNSKMLKNIFAKLMLKAHSNSLTQLDKSILVYLVIDIGRKTEGAENVPIYWYSRKGR